VRGELATGEWAQKLTVAPIDAGTGNQAIFALYGREQVADLEARWNETFDREIEAIGLAFQISTRMTSWIAVDESRKVALAKRKVDVPQELPYGTTAESFGLRRPMQRPTGQMIGMNAFAAQMDVGEASFAPADATLLGSAGVDDLDEEFPGGPAAAESTRILRSQSADFEGEEPTGDLSLEPRSYDRPRSKGEAGAPPAEEQNLPATSFVLEHEADLAKDQKEGGGGWGEDKSRLVDLPELDEPPAAAAPAAEYKRAMPAPALPAQRSRRRASTVPGIVDAPARPSSMQAKGSPLVGGSPSGGPPPAPQPYPQYQPSPQPQPEMQEQAITTGKLPARKPSRHWLAFWLILMLAALIAALVWWMA
jgi:Ca-activated chloride channel family protein